MKCLTCIIIAFSLAGLTSHKLSAQFYKPSNISLNTGDTLPESFFQTTHSAVNMQSGDPLTIRLSDYRDKLIVLDFWASWCGPCIHSLNKMSSLNMNSDERHIVIPVTYQSRNQVSKTYEKYKWDFVGIVEDTILNRIFPHSGLPHMVWLKDGKVLSMPQAMYVTNENFNAALDGEMLDLPQQFKEVNTSQPIVSRSRQGYKGTLLYQSSIVGGDPAYGQHGLEIVETDGYFILTMCNLPFFGGLIYEAFQSELPSGATRKKSLVWNMDSLSKMKYVVPSPKKANFNDIESFRKEYDGWVASHQYTYSLKLPVAMGREALYKVMKADFSRFAAAHLGLEVKIENRPEPTIVINELK